MSNKAYDIINKIQRWLPAVGVFYLTISSIWHLPFGDEINKTIVALATLIATFLEIQTGVWSKDNTIEVHNISNDLKQIEEEITDEKI